MPTLRLTYQTYYEEHKAFSYVCESLCVIY